LNKKNKITTKNKVKLIVVAIVLLAGMTIYDVFHECQVQGFFEILELKFTFVNEHFKISKVTLKLAFVKNAKSSKNK